MFGPRARKTRLLVVIVTVALTISMLAAGAGAAANSSNSSNSTSASPTGTSPASGGRISLGLPYLGGQADSISASGVDASSVPSDNQTVAMYKAGLAAINADGGIGGCQVDGIIFNFSTDDFSVSSQKE